MFSYTPVLFAFSFITTHTTVTIAVVMIMRIMTRTDDTITVTRGYGAMSVQEEKHQMLKCVTLLSVMSLHGT